MRERRIKGLFLFLLPGVFAACFASKQVTVTPEDSVLLETALEIDLFSARGFLGGSDYEHYHFKDDALWRECGNIVSEKKKSSRQQTRQRSAIEGDDVLGRDPDLRLGTRRAEAVSTAVNVRLRKQIIEMVAALQKQGRSDPTPGSILSLAGPGLFELSIRVGDKTHRYVTSVDAVSDRQTPTAKQAFETYSLIRSIGPVICDATTFFGIPRKKDVG